MLFQPMIKKHLDGRTRDFQDEIVWLLGHEKIFFASAKKLVVDAIDNFIAKYLQSEPEQKFIDRFEEIKRGILEVEGYFVIDGLGSHVRHWIWDGTPLEIWRPKTYSRYSAGVYDEYDITELHDHVTDFVVIDGEKITLIPNNEFRESKYFMGS